MLWLSLLLSVPLANGTVVYHGRVPESCSPERQHYSGEVVRLSSSGPDYLLLKDDTSLVAFTVGASGLRRVGALPLPEQPPDWEVARNWMQRDMDGDGLAEFLVANGSQLWKFAWRDSAFALVEMASLPEPSAWIEDFVFGDVDGDGLDELLLVAGDHRPLGESDAPDTNALFVCRWQPSMLRVLWTDDGALELDCASSVVPPDELVGVYDIRNTGQRELIYVGVESSVGPFTYYAFSWNGHGLSPTRTFALDESTRFAPSVPDSERFWFVMGFVPTVQDGTTRLYATSVNDKLYGTGRFTDQTIELHGDTVVAATTRPNRSDEERPMELDPDGRGTGMLRFLSGSDGGLWFEFRR